MPNHNLENSNSIFAKHSFRVVYVSIVKIIVLITIKALTNILTEKESFRKKERKQQQSYSWMVVAYAHS
jgi:hypothetical protein